MANRSEISKTLPSAKRIASILAATCLEESITGIKSFELNQLRHEALPSFTLPTKLRLGHIAEKTVLELLKASCNYTVLHENRQVASNGKTIGELDAIIRDTSTGKLTHLEIAYKFYLLDPTISSGAIQNWVGPNRNDTLFQKLQKLKTQQFPLLHHPEVANLIGKDVVDSCEQALCFMAHLYVPWEAEIEMHSNLSRAVLGYYFTLEQLSELDHGDKQYYIPVKTDWGIYPASNDQWFNYHELNASLEKVVLAKRSVLCWQKDGNRYASFFVVWW